MSHIQNDHEISKDKEIARLKKERDEAVEKLGEVLSTLNHEVRNSLTAIIGMGDLVENNEIHDDDERQFVGHSITKSGRNLLKLVDDLREELSDYGKK